VETTTSIQNYAEEYKKVDFYCLNYCLADVEGLLYVNYQWSSNIHDAKPSWFLIDEIRVLENVIFVDNLSKLTTLESLVAETWNVGNQYFHPRRFINVYIFDTKLKYYVIIIIIPRVMYINMSTMGLFYDFHDFLTLNLIFYLCYYNPTCRRCWNKII